MFIKFCCLKKIIPKLQKPDDMFRHMRSIFRSGFELQLLCNVLSVNFLCEPRVSNGVMHYIYYILYTIYYNINYNGLDLSVG
jgi:hypothetical protein